MEKTELTKIIEQADNITRKLNRGAIEDFKINIMPPDNFIKTWVETRIRKA